MRPKSISWLSLVTVWIVFTAVLVSCGGTGSWGTPGSTQSNGLPAGVEKFEDGDVTCYKYYNTSLTCVR